MNEKKAADKKIAFKISAKLGKRNFLFLFTAFLALIFIAVLALNIWLLWNCRNGAQLKIMQLRNRSIQQQFAIDDLRSKIEKILQPQKQTRNRLILNEVRQLITQAKIYLVFAKDARLALDLLNEANRLLADFTETSAVDIRSALAYDLNTLQQLPEIDVVAVIARLDNLSKSLLVQLTSSPKNLPLVAQFDENAKAKTDGEKLAALSLRKNFWHSFCRQTLTTLERAFIIRKPQQPQFAFSTPEERYSFVLSMQLKLELAKWALLQRQERIYQDCITQTINALQSYAAYFPSAYVANVLHSLRELQKIKLPGELPNLGALERAIEDAIKHQI